MQMSAVNMEFINWKPQRRRKDTKEKKDLGTLLRLVIIIKIMVSYNVILKGLSSHQRSTNAFELLGELIWTLVYTSIFTAER